MLTVLYRDAQLLALDKPSGLSLYADRSGDGNLWDLLKTQLADDGVTPLSVHRLDKGTSGVLLAALTSEAQSELTRAFQARAVAKSYVARVTGTLDLEGTGRIDLPLRKGRKSRYRVAGPRDAIVRTDNRWTLASPPEPGVEALTRLRVLDTGDGDTLLLLAPTTGRTHQLRVHLAWIGHPIRGDHLYGRPRDDAQRWPRLALHCHKLAFELRGRRYCLRARLPEAIRSSNG